MERLIEDSYKEAISSWEPDALVHKCEFIHKLKQDKKKELSKIGIMSYIMLGKIGQTCATTPVSYILI